MSLLEIAKWDCLFRLPELKVANITQRVVPIAPSEKYEEGGTEWILEVARKLSKYEWDFPYYSENLRLYNQLALTKELDPKNYDLLTETEAWQKGVRVVYRPREVVNSVAAYHATKRDNECGIGKAFHIPAPRLIDAKGATAWGSLYADEANKVLRLSLPKAWMDGASYPVTVDPEFGRTDKGNTDFGGTAYVYVFGTYAVAGAITIQSLHAYTVNSGAQIRIGVYDKTTVPNIIIVESAATASAAADWVLMDVTDTGTSAGTYYFGLQQSGAAYFRYDTTTGKEWRYRAWSFGAFPSPFGDHTYESGTSIHFSIYATYSVPAAGLNIPVAMHHYRMQGIV